MVLICPGKSRARGIRWRILRPSLPSKKTLPLALKQAHRDYPAAEAIELWFADEARVGQRGRVTHRWHQRGVRPLGLHDQGFVSTHIFGAVCPARDTGVALVLTEVSTRAMRLFLDELSQAVTPGNHALVVMDGASWHKSPTFRSYANLTILIQPPYSPEVNPMERVWEYLRENRLSERVYTGLDQITDACCRAWNQLIAETGRICSLATYPWLPKVKNS